MKELLTTLNWVDYIVIIGLLRGAQVGYKGGIFVEVLRFCVFFCTYFVVFKYGPVVGGALASQINFLDGTLAIIIGGLLLGIITFLAFQLISLIVRKIVKGFDGMTFKLLGLLAGVARWAYFVGIAALAVQQLGLEQVYVDMSENSLLARHMVPLARGAYEYLASLTPDF